MLQSIYVYLVVENRDIQLLSFPWFVISFGHKSDRPPFVFIVHEFYGHGFLATPYQTLIPCVLSVHLPSKTWVIHVYARGFPDGGVADFMSIYISTSRVQLTAIRFHSS